MPSVTHVSIPSAFTPSTIAQTLARSRSLGDRQAAPIQKREAPAALATRASASTASRSISFSAFTPVSNFVDCGQYAQSSGQPPVFIDNKVEICTSAGSKFSRCTRAAWKISSGNGRAKAARTSSRVQSWRGRPCANNGDVWCDSDMPKTSNARPAQPYTKQNSWLRKDFIALSHPTRHVTLHKGGPSRGYDHGKDCNERNRTDNPERAGFRAAIATRRSHHDPGKR